MFKKNNMIIHCPNPFLGTRYEKANLREPKFVDDQGEKLAKWIKNPKNFLFIHSPVGLGKTYLCAAIWNWFFEKSIWTLYLEEGEWLKRLSTSKKEGYNPMWKIQDYCDSDIVFWDDFGAYIQNSNETFTNQERKDWMYEFINNRYVTQKPTIVTSNRTIEDLGSIFHERLPSRLGAKENLIIELIGDDKRKLGL